MGDGLLLLLRGTRAFVVFPNVCVCVTGALLKAVCVCSGLVSLSSSQSLGDQLMERWGGGLELHSWSSLPTGSGLGERGSTWIIWCCQVSLWWSGYIKRTEVAAS